LELSRLALGHPPTARGVEREQARAGHDATAQPLDLSHQRRAHARIVGDAFLRYEHRGHSGCVWLALADARRVDPPEAHQTIGRAALEEGAEARDLLITRGHHQLAADLVRDRVLLAERRHLPDAIHGETRLVRPGCVGETGVQHAAVVAALMATHIRLLL